MKPHFIAAFLVMILPALALAQDINAIIFDLGRWISILTGIAASAALLVFFWGLVRYIFAAGDEKSKDQGKRIMIGGIIALFVLFSVFGIIRFLQRSFNLQRIDSLPPPEVDVRGSGSGSGGGGNVLIITPR